MDEVVYFAPLTPRPVNNNLSNEELEPYSQLTDISLEIMGSVITHRSSAADFMHEYCKSMIYFCTIISIMGRQPYSPSGYQLIEKARLDLVTYRIALRPHFLRCVRAAEEGQFSP